MRTCLEIFHSGRESRVCQTIARESRIDESCPRVFFSSARDKSKGLPLRERGFVREWKIPTIEAKKPRDRQNPLEILSNRECRAIFGRVCYVSSVTEMCIG